MSTMHTRPLAALLALAAFVPLAPPAAAIALHAETQGSVSFVTGGVGSDEADAMRRASADYPLTLEMATAARGPRDAYISMARVDIRDAHGNPVLETTTDGPFLLARVPPGTYDVDVTWSGIERQSKVTVAADKRQHVLVEFPDVPGNH